MQIAENKVVAIDYKLTDEDGKLLDSSEGREPLHYLHGANNIIPGLESALSGKASGDEVEVVVSPGDGYGERNEKLRQTMPKTDFPEEVEVGMQFRASGDGQDVIVTVVDVKDDAVTIDGNHPLAGITLHFDVTVREVREASEEELAHGHVHGPGGHQH